MRSSAAVLVFALGAVVCAGAPMARADDDPKLAEAKALFRRGVSLYDVGDYEHALAEFRHSHDIYPSAENALNIAVCLERLGRFDEALDAYEEVLGRTRDDDESARVRRAMALIIPNVGALEITANVNGSIVVDGRPRGTLPLAAPLRVLPGAHRIRIIKDGYRTFETITVIDVRVSTRIDAALSPLEAAIPPPGPAKPQSPVPDDGPGIFTRVVSVLELGLGVGIALPAGYTSYQRPLSDSIPATMPIIGSAGVRVKSFYVGAFGQWGTPPTRPCCASYSDVRVGLEGAYYFRPYRRFEPWIGAAISYEWMTRPLHWLEYAAIGTPFADFDSFGSGTPVITPNDFETLSGIDGSVRGGVQYRFTSALAAGPFLDTSFGRYTHYSATTTRDIPLQPAANLDGKAFHAWFTLGVRMTFDGSATGVAQ